MVVIAIVAILAALILPSVQSVNETARTTRCANILRQWVLAFPMYANDHNGYLPTAHLPYTNLWQTNIGPYVAGSQGTYAYIPLRTNFHCPGDTAASTGWCYSTNLYLLTPPSNAAFTVSRFSDIPHPAETILLEEANDLGVWGLTPSSDPSQGMQYGHHGNGLANFAFADMHIQSLSSTAAPAMLAARQILLDPTLTPAR